MGSVGPKEFLEYFWNNIAVCWFLFFKQNFDQIFDKNNISHQNSHNFPSKYPSEVLYNFPFLARKMLSKDLQRFDTSCKNFYVHPKVICVAITVTN